MSERKLPPLERNAIIQKFSVGGFDGYLNVGLYEDGSPAEIFVTIAKQGSTIRGLLDSFAKMMSISLQYGAPLEYIISSFKDTRFEPMGYTGNSEIPEVSSLIDYICRLLEKRFLVNK